MKRIAVSVFGMLLVSASALAEEGWIQLFNGKNLDGWRPKITGYALDDNSSDTFRVENGVLKVSYDKYDKFTGQFGHLFYKDKFSNYRLRVEYRFQEPQLAGGPGWALRNSGVMIHCQDPATMRKDQQFPVCLEVQLLGGDGKTTRTTANLCTPGTNVVMDGKLHTKHCTDANSKTYPGGEWATVEIEVRADGKIRHIMDGETVIAYEQPQYDEKDADAKKLMEGKSDNVIRDGWISLQSESHPIEFRKVELLPLAD